MPLSSASTQACTPTSCLNPSSVCGECNCTPAMDVTRERGGQLSCNPRPSKCICLSLHPVCICFGCSPLHTAPCFKFPAAWTFQWLPDDLHLGCQVASTSPGVTIFIHAEPCDAPSNSFPHVQDFAGQALRSRNCPPQPKANTLFARHHYARLHARRHLALACSCSCSASHLQTCCFLLPTAVMLSNFGYEQASHTCFPLCLL